MNLDLKTITKGEFIFSRSDIFLLLLSTRLLLTTVTITTLRMHVIQLLAQFLIVVQISLFLVFAPELPPQVTVHFGLRPEHVPPLDVALFSPTNSADIL